MDHWYEKGDVLNGNSHITLQPRLDFFILIFSFFFFFSATLAMKSRLRIALGFSSESPFSSQSHSFLTCGYADMKDGGRLPPTGTKVNLNVLLLHIQNEFPSESWVSWDFRK